MQIKDIAEILPLVELKCGQKGKIASVHTKNHEALKKLMAMGILPGIKINLIQKFPSYVFQLGQSQYAVDKELAECILVRIST
ncbi:ferrous iron transport protein A [Candidatus Saganbacteria bacterium]|nr:ferrous iron transport protein A [Candidatus Saganbacteria bacterium]